MFFTARNRNRIDVLEKEVRDLQFEIRALREELRLRVGPRKSVHWLANADPRPSITVADAIEVILKHLGLELTARAAEVTLTPKPASPRIGDLS